MLNSHPDSVKSKQAESPLKPRSSRSLTPRLQLVGPESPSAPKTTRSPKESKKPVGVSDFDFSTPPWLLPGSRELLDENGILSIQNLSTLITTWLHDCAHVKRLSKKSISSYEESTRYLVWFVENRGSGECGPLEIYQFFEYCREGHKIGEGRWGIPGNTQPLSPRSQNLHYCNLRAMFRWAKKNKRISESPIEDVPVPKFKPTKIKPFSKDDIKALIQAAQNSDMPLRNVAILLFMWDTGVREAELCAIKISDLKWKEQCVTIRHGKGDVERTVIFGPDTAAALWEYLRSEYRNENSFLFTSQRGTLAGCGLTESGLYQLYKRLGVAAGIEGVRCSPHTMRHAFASHALENGALPDEVRRQLGHTTLKMTNNYVELADDFKRQRHNTASPVSNFLKEEPVIRRRGRPRKR